MRTLGEEPLFLIKKCSLILKGIKIPIKQEHHEYITILCTIGDKIFKKALIDLITMSA